MVEISKQLLQKYNTRDALIVVSSYPKKKETYSRGVCAVASFTKNTLLSLKESNPEKKIIVLAIIADKAEIYEEEGILVIRCFQRNDPLSYFRILKYAKSFTNVKDVLVEFEFSSFGDTLTTFFLSLLVWAFYLLGKNIHLVIHQVLLNLATLSGHIGLSHKDKLTFLLNIGLKFYYKFLTLPVSSVIVLEDELKKRLSNLVNKNKIIVIPHGVASIKNIAKEEAREILEIDKNELVILYFGYLTWYKGVDFLIKTFLNKKTISGKRVRLVVAGGASFTQGKKKHYKDYLKMIKKLQTKASNMISTGFLEERDIPIYFGAADLVLFPYRTFMSSSGSLATTLAFNKAFLISRSLEKLLNSKDIRECLQKAGLSKEDVIFDLKKEVLIEKVNSVLEKNKNKKLILLSRLLAKERSFYKIASTYGQILQSSHGEEKAKRFSVIPALTS